MENDRILRLVRPYLEAGPPEVLAGLAAERQQQLARSLSVYLDLLVRWNERTNLTAIRQPEPVVQRHFGESLFAGVHMAGRVAADATLMDLGSGAGFPGLPMQLLLPELRVTLVESQNKKASFLREVVRTLGLATEVYPERIETMAVERRFTVVTLRAVDNMELAIRLAGERVEPGGWLAVLGGKELRREGDESFAVPGAEQSWLVLRRL
jgi:16S rRNA (guanine527-N7)-methyltransferase